MDVAREYYRVFEDRLQQSGVELSNKSFDAVMNQIHSSEQEYPFHKKSDDGGTGIYSSPISLIESQHGRNYLVELIMPSSEKLMLFGSGMLSLSYYEGMDILEYRKKKISLMEALQILDRKTEKIEEGEMVNLLPEGSAKIIGETQLSRSNSQNHMKKGKGKEKKEKSKGKTAVNKKCAHMRQCKKEKRMMRLII